jgi:hypothetical protein
LIFALLTMFETANAASCVCARGSGGLPTGEPLRPWAGVVGLDYGLALTGDMGGWTGLRVEDLHGDSMAGMFMAPHLVHNASLTATFGLPANLAVTATVPYQAVFHVGESEMPGDVDLHALGDADLGLRWSHRAKRPFYGAGAALTFPTGVVSTDGVSTGRGALGATGNAFAGMRVHPKLALVVQVSGAAGFAPDPSGYVVAPTASLLAGAKWWTRENGDLNFSFYAMERWSGLDRKDALVYENSGYLITDLAVAVNWTFWKQGNRSASVGGRAQAPVVQIVGDPMYAENFGVGVGVSVVAF